ncbi:MAG TPA: hypothetical protein VHL34_11640 [Rhizomicrobium sp.]|nr:hypothetical protein [Rhizomicrobium sp.]
MTDQTPAASRPMMRWAILGAVALVVAGGAAGYFLMNNTSKPAATGPVTVAHTGADSLVDAANVAAAAEKGSLCERALTRAQSYGVLPNGTTLASTEPKPAQDKQFTCAATDSAGAGYTVVVEQTCDNLNDHACFVLRTISQADGTTLFDRKI